MSVRPPRSRSCRSLVRAGAAVAALVGGLVLGTAGPAAAEPAFGTAPVVVEPSGGVGTITSVTVGRHDGFDRVVLTVSGPALGYQVRYVERVTEDASGKALPLAGSAALLVTVRQTDWTRHPSPSVNRSPAYPGLRQIRSAGEFEGVAGYGIGQATAAGFRVFRLTGPDRIVVDLRHPPAAATTGPSGTGGPTPGGLGNPSTAGAEDASLPGDGRELAETGGGSDPVPVAILGGLLALAGLVVVGIGVHVARRPAG